jgi:CheY-like chemotaxis protein
MTTPLTAGSHFVLVADDDEDILSCYRLALERAGWSVATARDGAEVLRSLDGPRRPDALVLDIAMPGVDGVQVASALYDRVETRRIPIVMVTAQRSFGGGRHSMMEMDNIRQVMFKPFPLQSLVEGVADACRWRG